MSAVSSVNPSLYNLFSSLSRHFSRFAAFRFLLRGNPLYLSSLISFSFFFPSSYLFLLLLSLHSSLDVAFFLLPSPSFLTLFFHLFHFMLFLPHFLLIFFMFLPFLFFFRFPSLLSPPSSFSLSLICRSSFACCPSSFFSLPSFLSPSYHFFLFPSSPSILSVGLSPFFFLLSPSPPIISVALPSLLSLPYFFHTSVFISVFSFLLLPHISLSNSYLPLFLPSPFFSLLSLHLPSVPLSSSHLTL